MATPHAPKHCVRVSPSFPLIRDVPYRLLALIENTGEMLDSFVNSHWDAKESYHRDCAIILLLAEYTGAHNWRHAIHTGELRPWQRTMCFSRTPVMTCLLYTSPSPRDRTRSRMPSSA